MDLSISYLKGLYVKLSIKLCFSVSENCFILANSAGPDEMIPYATLNLGIQCLPKYLFTGKKRGYIGYLEMFSL